MGTLPSTFVLYIFYSLFKIHMYIHTYLNANMSVFKSYLCEAI